MLHRRRASVPRNTRVSIEFAGYPIFIEPRYSLSPHSAHILKNTRCRSTVVNGISHLENYDLHERAAVRCSGPFA